jgi:AcrR family transcriptional regulator
VSVRTARAVPPPPRAPRDEPTTGTPPDDKPRARAGRKLDHSRDGIILDAALAVLAAHGYEGMTIDMVAAEAAMARATVYRRWATKSDLVLDAVSRLSRSDVDADDLPDTGSFRGDMLALTQSYDPAEQQLRLQVMVALLSLVKADERLASAALDSGVGPWIAAHRALMERAISREEFPPADIDMLSQVIPLLYVSLAVQRLPITGELGAHLLDAVIIPALRGSA